jgi:hypothetical protein
VYASASSPGAVYGGGLAYPFVSPSFEAEAVALGDRHLERASRQAATDAET